MLNRWTFHSAGSLRFGRGEVASAGSVVEKLKCRTAFIITDEILAKAGLLDRVRQPLENTGISVHVFTGITPEPPVETIREATEAARRVKPDVVIGLGGGSNMDAAKLVALVLTHGKDATDYTGDCQVPGPIMPLVCIPTTAGTGSEVSAAAVFTDTARKMKVSCLSPYLRPAVALVDPALTDSCPPKVTADSGIDALTHAIEAFTCVDQEEFERRPPGGETVYQGKNTMADYMASECIMLIGRFLRRAVANGKDTEARDGMALAATLGGLAFANAGVALVHAMEYPVGGAVHVSHGAGNGLLLPYVMAFNQKVRADEIDTIGLWLGGPEWLNDPLSRYPNAAINQVVQLRRDIGIPLRLRDIGVTEEMLPGFAERAFGIKRLMRTNPRIPQSAAEIEAIYREAL